jgi:hypothetical protein
MQIEGKKMSWTDRIAFSNILKLKDEFNIKTVVVTGVGAGGDPELYGHYFKNVYAMDIDEESIKIARKRMKYLKNVHLFKMQSADFLKTFKSYTEGTTLFYLDAHYFDPKLKQKWVVIDELKVLKGFRDCVIIIHDYDNGELGHLIYAGEHMGWNVVGAYLYQVNPYFKYYTNTREMCDIYDEKTIHNTPIRIDGSIINGLKYANSSDVKKYRGILYAVPREIDIKDYQLKEGHG